MGKKSELHISWRSLFKYFLRKKKIELQDVNLQLWALNQICKIQIWI